MSETDEKRTWPISARLKQARAASQPKLSQLALAQKVQALGLAYFQNGKASRLESGYAYATWVEIESIARVLNVDPHWLANIEKPVMVPKAPAVELTRETPPLFAPGSKVVPTAKAAPASKPTPTKPAPKAKLPTPEPTPPAKPWGQSAATPPPAPSTPEPSPTPSAPEPPPFPIPPQGTLTVSDYRTLLGTERRKAEEAMGQKGLPAAEWRRWREYSRNLTEVLRSVF